VTEIGEKEKMKSKLLATLVVLTLLCGMFATAIQFSGTVNAGNMYHLDVYTDPAAAGIPINGTQDYPEGTYVEVQALNEYIVDDTRYLFSYWDVDGGYAGTTNPYKWVLMNADHNITAHYNTQYKFTVSYPWNALWTESFTPWIWQETGPGTGFVAGSGANGTYWAWIPQYEKVQAGISSLHWDGVDYPPFGVPWIRGRYLEEVVIFTNWTSLGYYMSGRYAWSKACKINMTGPMSATMQMKLDYWLWVTSNQPPAPAGQGWYDQGAIATLTANPIVVNWAREWRLDHWEVDTVSRGQGVNPINVTMNTNHTASAFYRCWVFVYLADDISNATGMNDNGKWYLEGVPYKFTANSTVPLVPPVPDQQWRFAYWKKDPGAAWINYSNPVWRAFDSTWAGYTLRAVYYLQFYVRVVSSPTVSGFLYPDSNVTGWYDYNAPINCKARPIVDITPDQSHWKFVRWEYDSILWSLNNNVSGTIDRPYNLTAYYTLEWHLKWNRSPTTITVPGFPNDAWVANGTSLNWWAPGTDVSTVFVFNYWVIDGITRAQGQQTVPILHDHYIVGTAYYANKTKLYMDPDYHNETAHAYCHTFDVTIWASNFDANRLVPNAMDIYGFDIIIDFPANLIEVQDVTTNLADFFYPNDYFPKPNGKITINNMFGYVQVIATVKGNFTGFTHTKWIFKITFHVKYDPCYPYHEDGLIRFSYVKLVNHLDQQIQPEIPCYMDGCIYNITTVKPVLEIRNAVDHTDLVKVDTNDPQTFFDVEVYLHNGVKVKDFIVKVDFNKWHIQAVSVAIATYLKPPYTIYSWQIDNCYGWVEVEVVQDPSVPLQNCSGLLFTIRFKVVQAIWYSICGPHDLQSDITISYGELSVICWCGPYDQTTTNTFLGSKKCHYIYNPLKGDLDYDGWVTVLDLQLILDHYGWWWPWGYDITGDHRTDISDLVYVALRFNNHV
jgi:hypothetical protein